MVSSYYIRMDTGSPSGRISSYNRERFLIYFLTFVMGACGIAYEYTLSKISSDLLGNSVRQWAVIIGLMMFFMGIGSDVQKHIRDRNLLDRFIVVELIQGLIGGFGPIVLYYVFGANRDYFRVLQYLFIISIGLIIGLEIPLLTRVNERYTRELRINIGGILRSDYIGAFLGAVIWIFVLLVFFSPIQVGFVLGALNILVSGLIFFYFKRFSKSKLMLIPLISIGFLALVIGFIRAPIWSYHSEQQLFLDRIIYSKTTKYQHIVLTETRAGDIYCYINGNLQFSSIDEYIYHESLVHPAMQIVPKRSHVLVLGGGDGLAVREILKYPDVQSVTVVDIDPEMTRIARDHSLISKLNNGAFRNERVAVVDNHALVDAGTHEVFLRDKTKFKSDAMNSVATVYRVNIDAARFVEQIGGVYDVIVIDFPDPNNPELAKLYSRSFYHRVASKLARYGVLVQQSTSPIHTKEAFLCIGRTMDSAGLSAIPFHDNVPTFGEWGWWIGGKSTDYTRETLREKMRGVAAIDVPTKYITGELISTGLVFGKGQLESQYEDINTLMNSRIFTYYHRAVQLGR